MKSPVVRLVQRFGVLGCLVSALVTAGQAADLREGARMAAESIDSGVARRKLDELAVFTNRPDVAG